MMNKMTLKVTIKSSIANPRAYIMCTLFHLVLTEEEEGPIIVDHPQVLGTTSGPGKSIRSLVK